MIPGLVDFFKNKKMYLVGFILVLIGVTEGLFGVDIPGVDVGSDWLGWILAGLGIGATKAAIVKSSPQ